MAKLFIGQQTTSKHTLSVRIWSKDLFSAVNNEIRRKAKSKTDLRCSNKCGNNNIIKIIIINYVVYLSFLL